MRLIEIDCVEISLTGITLNSTFTVRNTHQILAVMFEVTCYVASSSRDLTASKSSPIEG